MKCSRCKKQIKKPDSIGTGYGLYKNNKKVCYQCCADDDIKWMETHNKTTLYLSETKPDEYNHKFGNATVTNWPASLKLHGRYKKGRHNIAGVRYDVWFKLAGVEWWGVQYGDNTQILHCKKLV